MNVHHLVVTRFNLEPWKGDRPAQHLDPEWLEARLELFEAITAPCMRAQTASDFDWCILVHPATAEPIQNRLRASHPNIRLIEVGGASRAPNKPVQIVHRLAVDAAERHDMDVLLQSRIDTDDGVRADYFEELRREIRPTRTEFLNFPRGYQLDIDRGRATRHHWPSNSLMNVAQPRSAHPVGIHDVWHTRVEQVAPLRHLPTRRMWLHVIHGLNVSSRLGTGRPVTPVAVLSQFAIDPELVTPRAAGEQIRDLGRWVRGWGSIPRPSQRLLELAPARVTSVARGQRRANRLRDVVARLRGTPDGRYAEVDMEAILDAWGVGERLPSPEFLLDLVRVATSTGTVVECGSGLTTVLLHIIAPGRCATLDPDPARRAETMQLLHRLGLDGRAPRLATTAEQLPTTIDHLVVNTAGRSGSADGYELAVRVVTRLDHGSELLFDDARRATEPGGPLEKLGSTTDRPVVTFAKPKPYMSVFLSRNAANDAPDPLTGGDSSHANTGSDREPWHKEPVVPDNLA